MPITYSTISPIDLERAGFSILNTGGGCLAYARDLPDGSRVLVTDCNGGIDFHSADWYVALYDGKTGDEVQAHWCDLIDHEVEIDDATHGEETIEAALAACIGANADALFDALSEEYQGYCDKHGLPQLSADELLWELTPEQKEQHGRYVVEFIDRWEATKNLTRGG